MTSGYMRGSSVLWVLGLLTLLLPDAPRSFASASASEAAKCKDAAGTAAAGSTDIRCTLAFDYIDKNTDGFIDEAELGSYSRKHGDFLSTTQVQLIFDDADDDHSKSISRAEYEEQISEAREKVGKMKPEHIYVWMEHCTGAVGDRLLPYLAHLHDKAKPTGRDLLMYATAPHMDKVTSHGV